MDRKQFALRLEAAVRDVSYEKVLRALHPKMAKRIATLETLYAMSDALGVPRPVIVAASLDQAVELRSIVDLDAADAAIVAFAADADYEASSEKPTGGLRATQRSSVDGRDGRTTRAVGAVESRRPRTEDQRPPSLRRAARTR